MRETGAWVGWEVSVAGMGHGTMMMRWHVHGQRKELRLPGNLGALGEAVHSQPKLKAACGAHWMHLVSGLPSQQQVVGLVCHRWIAQICTCARPLAVQL